MACMESNLLTKHHIFIPTYRSFWDYYSFEVYIKKINSYIYDIFITRLHTSTIYLKDFEISVRNVEVDQIILIWISVSASSFYVIFKHRGINHVRFYISFRVKYLNVDVLCLGIANTQNNLIEFTHLTTFYVSIMSIMLSNIHIFPKITNYYFIISFANIN
jgi:hypothetical protein